MPRFVIKHSGGLIKDEKQANLVLIGFIVLVVIISLLIILSAKPDKREPSAEAMKQLKEMTLNP